MSEFMFITALMIWVVAGIVMIAGFYLIAKINDIERRVEDCEIRQEQFDEEKGAQKWNQ